LSFSWDRSEPLSFPGIVIKRDIFTPPQKSDASRRHRTPCATDSELDTPSTVFPPNEEIVPIQDRHLRQG
jgi:hypothetical protein